MSNHDILGAAPELATLRLLGHALDTTLDLLTAIHHPIEPPWTRPLPGSESVEDLVAALEQARHLAHDYAADVCKALMQPDDDPQRALEHDRF